MTTTSAPVLTVSHDGNGRPDFELYTRQPTRYDRPEHSYGPVPEHPDPDATAAHLRLRADGHGGVCLELITDHAAHRAVLVIDREDFASWAEQVAHLRDRIRAGY